MGCANLAFITALTSDAPDEGYERHGGSDQTNEQFTATVPGISGREREHQLP